MNPQRTCDDISIRFFSNWCEQGFFFNCLLNGFNWFGFVKYYWTEIKGIDCVKFEVTRLAKRVMALGIIGKFNLCNKYLFRHST